MGDTPVEPLRGAVHPLLRMLQSAPGTSVKQAVGEFFRSSLRSSIFDWDFPLETINLGVLPWRAGNPQLIGSHVFKYRGFLTIFPSRLHGGRSDRPWIFTGSKAPLSMGIDSKKGGGIRFDRHLVLFFFRSASWVADGRMFQVGNRWSRFPTPGQDPQHCRTSWSCEFSGSFSHFEVSTPGMI